ncbi:MAG: hypothetical protein ACFCU1_10495 [Sumerlaeia bacterium]
MTKKEKDAAIQVAAALAVAACIFMALSNMDLSAAKEAQKTNRAFQYMNFARVTIEDYIKKNGKPYEPTTEQTLPLQLTTDFAALQGGSPYFEAEGMYARLDFFGGDKPFGAPLKYYTQGQNWFIVSLGPDRVANLDMSDSTAEFPTIQMLEQASYDPTNGVTSSGDLILYEFKPTPRTAGGS